MAINSKIGAYSHNLGLSVKILTIARRHGKLSGVEDKVFVGITNQENLCHIVSLSLNG